MANLSQHLAVMRSTNIVNSRREGVTIYYSLSDKRIMQAFNIITEILMNQLDRDEKLRQEFVLHLQDTNAELE